MSTDRPRRIDTHHHLWDLSVRPQDWTAELPVLNRSFLMADYEPLAAAAGIDGSILVETVNVAPETPELLAVAAQHPLVRGVVGWVDLTAPDVADTIAALQARPDGDRLVGLRHQVQLEPDPDWLTRPDVLRGLLAVAEAGLVFELLVTHGQLRAATAAVETIGSGRFVLSHLGKPDIAGARRSPWAEDITRLAAFPNVAAKLSGMVTEAGPDWTLTDLRPYAAHLLDSFGADRVMLGSDWPVCLLAGSFATVWSAYEALVDELAGDQVDAVLGGSAQHWYGLS